ncbi:MAG TPA: deoxyribose-phosphate aldolase [Actinomycetota bacterium]
MDRDLAGLIDHTLLKPEATQPQIEALCGEAVEYGFAAVCVSGTWVPLAVSAVSGSPVKVACVAGFPLGAASTAAKVCEAEDSAANGAAEVDVVMNVGALRSGRSPEVEADLFQVVQAVQGRSIVKVILECALLNDAEKVHACQLAESAGAAFVKTSTGFGPGGATVEDVALLRRSVGPDTGVKASGGIRTREAAMAMVAAGATRLGTSSSVAIVTLPDEAPTPDA